VFINGTTRITKRFVIVFINGTTRITKRFVIVFYKWHEVCNRVYKWHN
jgi:hypothetical protein